MFIIRIIKDYGYLIKQEKFPRYTRDAWFLEKSKAVVSQLHTELLRPVSCDESIDSLVDLQSSFKPHTSKFLIYYTARLLNDVIKFPNATFAKNDSFITCSFSPRSSRIFVQLGPQTRFESSLTTVAKDRR